MESITIRHSSSGPSMSFNAIVDKDYEAKIDKYEDISFNKVEIVRAYYEVFNIKFEVLTESELDFLRKMKIYDTLELIYGGSLYSVVIKKERLKNIADAQLTLVSKDSTGGGTPPPASYEPEAEALFARMTVAPDDTRKGVINTLIASLKTAGVWSKLDALYLFAAHDQQAARQNWIQNNFNITESGGPTFTVDQGYKGNGSSAYLDTNYIPSSHTNNHALNSACFGIYFRTNTTATGHEIHGTMATQGSGGTSYRTQMRRPNGYYEYYSMCINGGNVDFASTDRLTGLYLINRPDSSNIHYYVNAAEIFNAASTAGVLPDQSILFLASWDWNSAVQYFENDEISAGVIGAGLTTQEITDLTNAINQYLTSVGAI